MSSKLIASSALLALAGLASAQGNANVVNNCNYDIYLSNVPAGLSGVPIIGPLTIAPGGSYTQVWTELATAGGWSIKLSTSIDSTNVLQYEYSFPGGDTIFFDMSEINGDPWGGNWLFSGDNGCTPDQNAYLYPTDDLSGMQSCPSESSVTVTLCPSADSARAVRAARARKAHAPTTLVTRYAAAPTSPPSI